MGKTPMVMTTILVMMVINLMKATAKKEMGMTAVHSQGPKPSAKPGLNTGPVRGDKDNKTLVMGMIMVTAKTPASKSMVTMKAILNKDRK